MLKVKADSTGLGPSTFGTGLQVCWLNITESFDESSGESQRCSAG